jgi:hypothetical protein
MVSSSGRAADRQADPWEERATASTGLPGTPLPPTPSCPLARPRHPSKSLSRPTPSRVPVASANPTLGGAPHRHREGAGHIPARTRPRLSRRLLCPAIGRLAGVDRPEGCETLPDPRPVLPDRNADRRRRVLKLAQKPLDLLSFPLKRASRAMTRHCRPNTRTSSLRISVGDYGLQIRSAVPGR